ncbi:pyridoxamine 5'-phosphate oxidase family protein [Kitasatospora sp. NBC_01287]|uniref:pyridoxamine 5'-phosphate oxidase family protein n=1 Tax=Kitasatospora sp. NBC_01287 TaxID=2903573 RepID=UPI002252D971|nr:pyridoxamine 5'-phosphate oxidase family protein [Kitasatospora sp. NBC_01287]MCX4744750.1 pyridoxamine 5'-phosphate oxidase family protein [Kitasatospora sp. NBC_01287]
MKATIGDRVIVEGTRPGTPRRDGRVTALHHPDGDPPWDVLWSDNGHTTTFFPGPDTHLHHFAHHDSATCPPERPDAPDRPEAEEAGPGQRAGEGVDRARPGNPGDVGRRVARRRERQGLSREQVAAQAGMAVPYLEYLETSTGVADRGTLVRLAAALDTSVDDLLGGGLDLPPGRDKAAAHPVLEELAHAECWQRLATYGIGRIALTTASGPVVLPVNYWVLDGTLIFRTAADGPLAGAVGARVALEVDRIDEVLRTGWSVLAVGTAARVDDQPALAHLKERDAPSPWAGGERDLWVRIKPTELSGRVIRTPDNGERG